MEQQTIELLFALLRSAISEKATEENISSVSDEQLSRLFAISQRHDVSHLLALGLKQNSRFPEKEAETDKNIFKAIYRYERINFEYTKLCEALELGAIPFVPLKGSVLRRYYPEAWMRTSCDIDILVHREDLESAIAYLTENLKYVEKERATHDVSLYSPSGIHIELHFDLVEEGRANDAIEVLGTVWENLSLCEGKNYWYEMTDEFFYFYHIAHMAKHFETGGCGIRPFIDLWILDNIDGIDQGKRDELLSKGDLLQFANSARRLSRVWFDAEEHDGLSLKLQEFILHGGVYGSIENRVALQQKKRGGRVGYILSRIFVPYTRLKRYYPILEKHPWLMPFMQVRRWFMLMKGDVAKMAKQEIAINSKIEKKKTSEMCCFLREIGLK